MSTDASGEAPDAVSQQLASAIRTWYEEASPPVVTGSAMSFALTIYAAGTQRPIVRLTNIVATVPGSAWWGNSS